MFQCRHEGHRRGGRDERGFEGRGFEGHGHGGQGHEPAGDRRPGHDRPGHQRHDFDEHGHHGHRHGHHGHHHHAAHDHPGHRHGGHRRWGGGPAGHRSHEETVFGFGPRGPRGDRGDWGGGGGGGRHGGGGGDGFRLGRWLAQGDLKLLALAFIAEQPRHGYEIIKLVEEKTGGSYAPSPGVVYPTLTYLEEAGFAASEPDGAKKRYAITEEGRAYLAENRAMADAILARLSDLGGRMGRMRRWMGLTEGGKGGDELPRLVEAALENLRDAAQARLGAAQGDEVRVVEILARAAQEIRGA